MHADTAAMAEPKLELPKDLLSELQRRKPASQADSLHVEGWKPSFFGRLFGLFGGAGAR